MVRLRLRIKATNNLFQRLLIKANDLKIKQDLQSEHLFEVQELEKEYDVLYT